MSIKEKILAYYAYDVAKKDADSHMKPLNGEIKEYMRDNDLKKEIVDHVTVSYTIQERADTNNAKLLMRLKELGLDEAIDFIEVPNQEKIEQMVYEGKLIPAQIADCIEVKKVEVLKVTGKKVSK